MIRGCPAAFQTTKRDQSAHTTVIFKLQKPVLYRASHCQRREPCASGTLGSRRDDHKEGRTERKVRLPFFLDRAARRSSPSRGPKRRGGKRGRGVGKRGTGEPTKGKAPVRQKQRKGGVPEYNQQGGFLRRSEPVGCGGVKKREVKAQCPMKREELKGPENVLSREKKESERSTQQRGP